MGKDNSAGQTKTGEQPRPASQASDAAAIPREQLISEAAYYKQGRAAWVPAWKRDGRLVRGRVRRRPCAWKFLWNRGL